MTLSMFRRYDVDGRVKSWLNYTKSYNPKYSEKHLSQC